MSFCYLLLSYIYFLGSEYLFGLQFVPRVLLFWYQASFSISDLMNKKMYFLHKFSWSNIIKILRMYLSMYEKVEFVLFILFFENVYMYLLSTDLFHFTACDLELNLTQPKYKPYVQACFLLYEMWVIFSSKNQVPI